MIRSILNVGRGEPPEPPFDTIDDCQVSKSDENALDYLSINSRCKRVQNFDTKISDVNVYKILTQKFRCKRVQNFYSKNSDVNCVQNFYSKNSDVNVYQISTQKIQM